MKYFSTLLLLVLVSTGHAQELSDSPYTIRVTSDVPGQEVTFKGAVGQNGVLVLINETTPYSIDLEAFEITAMFEAIEPEARIEAELFATWEGTKKSGGSFTGHSGRIIERPFDQCVTREFTGI